ncbi:Malic enzyme [Verticillium dahliae VDG1]|nr:Malic enzyme [Verticillium dahliae VDG1]
MTHNATHSSAASAVMSWAAQTSNMPSIADEDIGDVDEPPDSRLPYSPMKSTFTRNPIRNSVDVHHHQSLLTKALHYEPEEEHTEPRSSLHLFGLRRCTTSNASIASTADLTSDTGMTSPSRTNTPSPPLPELRFLKLNNEPARAAKEAPLAGGEESQKTAPPRKRCIQFACAAKPTAAPKPVEAPKPQDQAIEPKPDAPRKRCIKFACPAPRPVNQSTPPQHVEHLEAAASRLQPHTPDSSPATPMSTKKYITVDDKDLQNEASRFHEFASDDHCDEDWMRETVPVAGRKMTVNDTLAKENEIRKLAKEAEEEADEEENDDETAIDDDDDLNATAGEEEEDEDEDEDDDDIDDGLSGYVTEDEDDDSIGYHTDEETGFADSDDEADDDLQLWTPAQPALRLSGPSSATPVGRRASIGHQSDSSLGSISSVRAVRSGKSRRIKIRPGTPELPDSTDFVCGTLDEDRPIEDAYLSCLAARRREKLHVIPQDIDPSFPASEPEDNGEEELYNPVKHASDDDDVWLHGEMDDLDHQQERRSRKKKSEHSSPKRYHSPPPKQRYHSPPPKNRGRSPPPKRLFDRRSPCRMGSPALQVAIAFKELASRPGLTMTKSLPRPAAWFNMRNGRRNKALMPNAHDNDVHIRSAIDIVKGLEQKRQRRKEKYYQKYCNRARKGQKPERKPMPGMGCVRMRELGLLMAGKIDQGNYVLSV